METTEYAESLARSGTEEPEPGARWVLRLDDLPDVVDDLASVVTYPRS